MKSFNELYKKYGLYHTTKTRNDLTEDAERKFVKDCFDIYEHIGFTDTFETPYIDEKKYVGMKFTVLSRVRESTNENGIYLSSLPMWNIQFENGDKISAYPEEICLAEK